MRRRSISLPWEGRRRVLGEEHKKTLGTLNNMGYLLQHMEDYEGALDYFHQSLRAQEKVLGKIHPDTLTTIVNMASAYSDLNNFTKAEQMYRLALDGSEKSLGKGHKLTKRCAAYLAILFFQAAPSKEKLRELA